MTITFLLPCYAWTASGGHRAVYEWANGLVARGHQVAVVHPRYLASSPLPPPPNLYRWARRRGWQLRHWLLRPSLDWQPVDRRVKLLYVADFAPRHIPDGDAVFATGWQTAEDTAQLPASKGVKFYLIQSYETWGGPEQQVRRTWMLPLNKVVIARWLQEKASKFGETATLINCGVNLHSFRLINPIENRDPFSVAMMYHTISLKGSLDGLEALTRVRRLHPRLRVTLFGTPRRNAGIPSWVTYVQNPKPEQLVAIYNAASIFVQPSWTEGWPLPGSESMACGCALATTACGGAVDYTEHEVSGLVSPPKDPEQLAENILRLVDDSHLRIGVAREGHRRIQEYTWDRAADLLEEHIRKVTEQAHASQFENEA